MLWESIDRSQAWAFPTNFMLQRFPIGMARLMLCTRVYLINCRKISRDKHLHVVCTPCGPPALLTAY